jgi:hypothetical protein
LHEVEFAQVEFVVDSVQVEVQVEFVVDSVQVVKVAAVLDYISVRQRWDQLDPRVVLVNFVVLDYLLAQRLC